MKIGQFCVLPHSAKRLSLVCLQTNPVVRARFLDFVFAFRRQLAFRSVREVRGFGSGDMPLRQQFLRAPSGIRVLVELSSDTSNHKLTRAAWGSQFLGMKESAEVHSIVQS